MTRNMTSAQDFPNGFAYRSLLRTPGFGLVPVLFILAFAWLAGEMLEGDTRVFDTGRLGAA